MRKQLLPRNQWVSTHRRLPVATTTTPWAVTSTVYTQVMESNYSLGEPPPSSQVWGNRTVQSPTELGDLEGCEARTKPVSTCVYTVGGDMKGRQRQNEPEPREGTDGTNLRFLDIPAVGLVIKEIFLNIKAQAVLLKGLQPTLPESAVYPVDGR